GEPCVVASAHHAGSPPQTLRVAECRCKGIGGQFAAQKRQIGIRIVTEKLRISSAAFCKREAQALSTPDDVAVGEYEPVSGDNHPGADSGTVASLGNTFDSNDGGTKLVGHRGHRARIRVERSLFPLIRGPALGVPIAPTL